MNEMYQSPVLSALGWAIAGSFWQVALLWLIHQVFFTIPFRHKPALKHGSAVFLLGGGAAWFIITFFQRLDYFREMQNYIYFIEPFPEHKSVPSSFSFTTIVTEAEKYLPYFSAAYLFILAFLLMRLAQGIIRTRQISNDQHAVPAHDWQHFVDRLSIHFNISREVFVYLSDAINVPATIGFIRPVILLPVATFNNLTISQAEAIILHEIAHIRRHDYLINIFVSIIETLLYFNPFAHLLAISIRKERELCCDDFVIGYQRDPQVYAHALLSLEKSRIPRTLAIAATGKESLLLGRVKRILKIPDQQVQLRQRLLALFLVASMIMMLAMLNLSGRQDKKITGSSTLSSFSNGYNLNYKLPVLFNTNPAPAQNEKPSVSGKFNKREKNKKEPGIQKYFQQDNDLIVSLKDLRNNKLQILRNNKQMQDYPDAIAMLTNPMHITEPDQENEPQFYFEFPQAPPSPDNFDRVQSPDGPWKIGFPGMEMQSDLFKADGESLLKMKNNVDLKNLIDEVEKVRSTRPGNAGGVYERMYNKTIHEIESNKLSQEYFRDAEIANQDAVRKAESGMVKARERIKSSPLAKTFSDDKGTVISIISDEGRIEIRVKGKQ